jgi:predicted metal-dependent phosphoesterase TrpH
VRSARSYTALGDVQYPLIGRICRESYNDPAAVYETLKSRGMDLVTVTDHDSIDAAEQLRRYPDFFLSEEVTCITPSETEIHVGVYGIEERHHQELQKRRRDVPALAAYLREQALFYSINHVFSSLTGRRVSSRRNAQWTYPGSQ